MTPAQKTALEGLVGRPLTTPEVTQIDGLLPIRDDVAIAAVLSTGRVKYQTKMISERGVRAALSTSQGSVLLRLFKETAKDMNAGIISAWLPPTLTAAGVPAFMHLDYAEAIASAQNWLLLDAGLDIGSTASRQMLDLVAMSDSAKYGAAVTILKALASQPDPINFNAVSNALNVAEGRMTL